MGSDRASPGRTLQTRTIAKSALGVLVHRHVDYTRDRIQKLVPNLYRRIDVERHPAKDLVVAGPTKRISHAQAQELREFAPALAARSLINIPR
jgi:hypothetical protein